MHLSDLIDPKSVKLDKQFGSVDDILMYVAKRFSQKTTIAQEVIFEQLKHREELGGTCISDGVIVPHTRIDGVDDIVIDIIRIHPDTNIRCTGNNLRIKYVFAILSSKKLAAEYLKVLKGIVELIKNLLPVLDTASGAEEFFGIIERAAISIESYPVASDMVSPAVAVHPGDSLAVAVDIMRKQHVEELAVIDETGMFLGMVDVLDFLQSAFPEYVFKFDDLSFLSEFEPLREFLSHEARGVVGEFMVRKPGYEIDAEVSYVEVVFKFVKSRQKYVYVTRNGKLLGIITPDDIIGKLLRS